MTKRTSDWIRIKQPDGSEKIAAPHYILKLLGLSELEDTLRNIEYRISELEVPMIQAKILKLLKQDGGFHTAKWIVRRVYGASERIILRLLLEKQLAKKQSGNHILYGFAEKET